MKRLLRRLLQRPPAAEPAPPAMPEVLSADDQRILDTVRPFTMTSTERLMALIAAVRYVAHNRIAGDVAECGVWRGGSMMAVALTLLSEGDAGRTLHLYDTFTGMSEPAAVDRDGSGVAAAAFLARDPQGTGFWCEAPLDDVRRNLASTGYPAERICYVAGKVEDKLPAQAPGPLALLRLDTDWYASTMHELRHLFPLLVTNGVLIIDDYGHWQGCRQATDEYFASRGKKPLLQRIDYTGRLLIKTDLT